VDVKKGMKGGIYRGVANALQVAHKLIEAVAVANFFSAAYLKKK